MPPADLPTPVQRTARPDAAVFDAAEPAAAVFDAAEPAAAVFDAAKLDAGRPETAAGFDATTAALLAGSLTVTGRLADSSNVTLLCTVSAGRSEIPCVYKPIRGERALWDFPDGTLAEREMASFLISQAANWNCVPMTVLRDGPYGRGMVQQWIPDTDPYEMADLVPADAVPAGWLPVLRAVDSDGSPLVLAHADDPALATLAGFDLVVNNADRKATHVLPTPDGRVRGVDHGLTLHSEDKLRTIFWGWAGRPLPGPAVDGLRLLDEAMSGELGDTLAELITGRELAVLASRIAALLADPVFPFPPAGRTPIPWPPL